MLRSNRSSTRNMVVGRRFHNHIVIRIVVFSIVVRIVIFNVVVAHERWYGRVRLRVGVIRHHRRLFYNFLHRWRILVIVKPRRLTLVHSRVHRVCPEWGEQAVVPVKLRVCNIVPVRNIVLKLRVCNIVPVRNIVLNLDDLLFKRHDPLLERSINRYFFLC